MREITMANCLTHIFSRTGARLAERRVIRLRRTQPRMMLGCVAALLLAACRDSTAPTTVQVTLPIMELSAPDSVAAGTVIPVDFSVGHGACTMFSRYTVEITTNGAAITAWGTQPVPMPTCTMQLILVRLHADVPTRPCGGNITITARQPSGADSITRQVIVTPIACSAALHRG